VTTPLHRRDLLRLWSLSALAGAAGFEGPSASAGPAEFAPQTTPGSGFVPDVELVLTAAPNDMAVLPGGPTRLWRFTGRLLKDPADTLQALAGSYLGPVIRLRRGQKVRVRFANQIAEPSIVHWHGLDVAESADGHPRLAIGHGHEYVYNFEVTNRAGTYWYHPHPMGMEAAHPIHLHGRQLRVLDRTGGRATNTLRAGIVDTGWRDTVLVLRGETVRVQATFTRHPGLYLYHCHILEHEDMGMMRNFRVT